MNTNIVFTIVAKNYLPLAYVLGNSLLENNPELSYCILLADSTDNIDLDKQPFKIYELSSINIDAGALTEMKFKYNVTEFCTAVKPYFFEFLFNNGFKKAVYFDPDICTFSSIQEIFNELETKSIVITPHFCTPELNYSGTITESLLLHVGAFNFGFIAVNSDSQGLLFIGWWMRRLQNQSFQDKLESLHTDQKWGDLLPALFGKDLHISTDIGRNVAFWNLHERILSLENDQYFVENKINDSQIVNLMFFHFAGYDIKNENGLVHKNNYDYKLSNFPELSKLFDWYKVQLIKNRYHDFIKFRYGFDKFDNEKKIYSFHRRIYRRLVDDGNDLGNPFESNSKMYSLFGSNNLIIDTIDQIDKLNEVNYTEFNSKVKQLNILMRIVFSILKPAKYFLLLKFCQRYFRPENQTFLLKEFKNNYKFINENRQ